jgi:O-antigen/teichoic acid export membrane protein
VSGLAAYAFIALGTRSVGSDAFAAVSVLWTLWAISAAVFTFPVQHWVIRTIETDGGEVGVRSALRILFIASVSVSLLLGLTSWRFRSTLFGDDGLVFPVLAAIVPIGTVLMGLNRGVLSARRRFQSTAFAIAGENLIRALAALAVNTAGGLGWALVGGFTIGAFWPSSYRLDTSGTSQFERSPLAFVGGVAGGSLVGQIVLTSGPVVLAILGGAPALITGLFSALALFRAPYMIAIGVTPRMTAWLTRTVIDGGQLAVRQLTRRVVLGAVVLLVVAGGLGATIGPHVLTLVFGPDVTLSPYTTALVGAGSAVAIFTLLMTLLMLAAGRSALISVAWALAALGGLAVVLSGVGALVNTVAAAFLAAEIIALAAFAIAAVRTPYPA